MYTALSLGIPLIPVTISADDHPGDGYDFEAAKAFLRSLRADLEEANPGAVALMEAYLEAEGSKVSFESVQHALSHSIPNVISVSLQPDGTANHWSAVVQDVIDKIATQAASVRSTTKSDGGSFNAGGARRSERPAPQTGLTGISIELTRLHSKRSPAGMFRMKEEYKEEDANATRVTD